MSSIRDFLLTSFYDQYFILIKNDSYKQKKYGLIDILFWPIFFVLAFLKAIIDLTIRNAIIIFNDNTRFNIKSKKDKKEPTNIGFICLILANIISSIIILPVVIVVDFFTNIWHGVKSKSHDYKYGQLNAFLITCALLIFFYYNTPKEFSISLGIATIILLTAITTLFVEHDKSYRVNALLFLAKIYIASFFFYCLNSIQFFALGINIILSCALLFIITASAVGIKNFAIFFEFIAIAFKQFASGFICSIEAIWQSRKPNEPNNSIQAIGIFLSLPLLLLILAIKLVKYILVFLQKFINLIFFVIKSFVKENFKTCISINIDTINDIFNKKFSNKDKEFKPIAILGYIIGLILNVILLLIFNTAKCFLNGINNPANGKKRYQGIVLLSLSLYIFLLYSIYKLNITSTLGVPKTIILVTLIFSLIYFGLFRKKGSIAINLLMLSAKIIIAGLLYYSLHSMKIFSQAINIVIGITVFILAFSFSKGIMNITNYLSITNTLKKEEEDPITPNQNDTRGNKEYKNSNHGNNYW